MNSLKNKAIEVFNRVKPYIPKFGSAGEAGTSGTTCSSGIYIKSIVIVFAVIILTLFLMFVGGWFYNTAVKKNADLSILIQLLTLMCSSGFVAMVIALLKFGVDKDGNGIPDILEDNSSASTGTSSTGTSSTGTSSTGTSSTGTSSTGTSTAGTSTAGTSVTGISATGAVKTHGD